MGKYLDLNRNCFEYVLSLQTFINYFNSEFFMEFLGWCNTLVFPRPNCGRHYVPFTILLMLVKRFDFTYHSVHGVQLWEGLLRQSWLIHRDAGFSGYYLFDGYPLTSVR